MAVFRVDNTLLVATGRSVVVTTPAVEIEVSDRFVPSNETLALLTVAEMFSIYPAVSVPRNTLYRDRIGHWANRRIGLPVPSTQLR
jgi:hypothetical protein